MFYCSIMCINPWIEDSPPSLAKGLETFIDLIHPSRLYNPPNENLAATGRMLLLSNTNGKKMVKQRSGFGYSFWH